MYLSDMLCVLRVLVALRKDGEVGNQTKGTLEVLVLGLRGGCGASRDARCDATPRAAWP